MRKILLTAQRIQTGKYFIMGNNGQLPNTPYYDTMKECMIEIFRLSQGKAYINIYAMSQREYEEIYCK